MYAVEMKYKNTRVVPEPAFSLLREFQKIGLSNVGSADNLFTIDVREVMVV
jgi:hypothetical protein